MGDGVQMADIGFQSEAVIDFAGRITRKLTLSPLSNHGTFFSEAASPRSRTTSPRPRRLLVLSRRGVAISRNFIALLIMRKCRGTE